MAAIEIFSCGHLEIVNLPLQNNDYNDLEALSIKYMQGSTVELKSEVTADLKKGITLIDIMKGVSQPRNTIIADIFYRLELIESYGTGIQKIFESYSESSRKPEIQSAPASAHLPVLRSGYTRSAPCRARFRL